MRVWLGWPVDVRIPNDGTDVRYVLYELASGEVVSVRETHTLATHTLALETSWPPMFTEANSHYRDSGQRSPVGGAQIALVGWEDGTMGGPFEVTALDTAGAAPTVSITAEVGSRFEDLLELEPVPIEGLPWTALANIDPWRLWAADGIDIVEIVRGGAIGATDAASLISILEAEGLTVAPVVTASYGPLAPGESVVLADQSADNRYFRYELSPRYLTLIPTATPQASLSAQEQLRWRVDAAGNLAIDTRRRPLSQRLSNADPDDDMNIAIPDAYNGLGAWRTRRLALGIDQPLGGPRILYESGHVLPTHYLPISVLKDASEPQIAFDRARWEMQNSSISARVVMAPVDLSVIPNQLLDFAGPGAGRLAGQTWRVGSIEYVNSEGDEYSAVDLVAWQGPFRRVST